MRQRLLWIALAGVVVVLFFWKIVFTSQFSVLLDYEAANQGYAPHHFAAATLKQGAIPLWDPYTYAGRSFIGEMQTALFYPPKLLLYLSPLDQSGFLSQRAFHQFKVLAHLLAACFMFLLAWELGLTGFGAFVASLCFSLGGFVSKLVWPDTLNTSIWLPLVLFFLLRALRAERWDRAVLQACLAGLSLGMAILAGSLHVVMMDVLVVVSAAAWFGFQERKNSGAPSAAKSTWTRILVIVALMGLLAFALGAIQLLPSLEYSDRAVRAVGDQLALPTKHKIPYAELGEKDRYLPRSLLAFLLVFPFGGAPLGTHEANPYFGVLPLLLVIIGVWRNWGQPWVNYLAGVATLAYFYTLGEYSLLHGVLYAVVPYLWMAREPVRFIYLAHFAMALLAGFGAQTLFSGQAPAPGTYAGLGRALRWVLIVAAVGLGLPAIYGKPEINEWAYFSFLFMLASFGIFVYVTRGHRTRAVRFLLAAIILCDLNATNWTMADRTVAKRSGTDHLSTLLDCRKLAGFFKSQPGLFRVDLETALPPNLGDMHLVQTTSGVAATAMRDFDRFMALVPRAKEMLNVRYVVQAKAMGQGKPVAGDDSWVVHENPTYCPRAWVVHEASVEPLTDLARLRVARPDFDPLKAAVVADPLEATLEPAPAGFREEVHFERYQADRLELRVRAASRGLLVLSEVDYPGWQATVNGSPARIHKVDALLRGVVVPAGESRVTLRYLPRSVVTGAILGSSALLGTLILAAVLWVKKRQPRA